MRTAARFHPDEARCTVGKVLKKQSPLDRLVHDLSGFRMNVVHLENLLGDVNAYGHTTIHRGSSGCRKMLAFSTWAHRCR